MRLRETTLVLVLLGSVAAAPVARGQSNEGGLAGDVANEKVVRKLYTDFTAAWNRHDVVAVANMWTIDGDHMEPDGTEAKGREAIVQLLRRMHEGPFKKASINLQVAHVWFITGEVALVDGGYAVSGVHTPDGKDLPERRGHLTSVLMREDGTWHIAASRLMIPTELPYKR